jgi:hypothetical protein
MFSVAHWRTLHGIRVGVFDVWEDRDEAQVFERIEAAFELMAAYEPRRLKRAARDIRRLWITRAAYAAAYYLKAWDMCVIDVKFITDEHTTPAKLATVFVHEATHARLFNCGIRYTEAARHRIEAVCVAESAFFARRLPDGEALARYVVECHPSDTGHWSDDNLNRRMLDARLQEVGETSLPRWLKRFLRRVLVSRAA